MLAAWLLLKAALPGVVEVIVAVGGMVPTDPRVDDVVAIREKAEGYSSPAALASQQGQRSICDQQGLRCPMPTGTRGLISPGRHSVSSLCLVRPAFCSFSRTAFCTNIANEIAWIRIIFFCSNHTRAWASATKSASIGSNIANNI